MLTFCASVRGNGHPVDMCHIAQVNLPPGVDRLNHGTQAQNGWCCGAIHGQWTWTDLAVVGCGCGFKGGQISTYKHTSSHYLNAIRIAKFNHLILIFDKLEHLIYLVSLLTNIETR